MYSPNLCMRENRKKQLLFLVKYGMIIFSRNLVTIKRRGEYKMKEGIHPEYKETTITCACGNVLEVGSTKENMKVDICSKCHPFWTGNLKQNTTGGRADRFKKKYGIQ